MPPNAVVSEPIIDNPNNNLPIKVTPRKYEILYVNVAFFILLHISAMYGIYLCFTEAMWASILFHFSVYIAADIGISAGAHRLWTHRSFKVKLPLEIILMIFNTLAFENTATHWVRDHRLHHKYTETDADPHNAARGFFYSHIGWLMVRKHPDVRDKGKDIDMSDIYRNPVLRFQKTYAIPWIGTVCFVLPTIIPMYFWGESLNCAWHLTLLRYVANLHSIFLVNSAAHRWGFRPYNKSKMAAHNILVTILTLGEGFHNYHHVFPWDYRSAELGNNVLNFTTLFIDFFAKIGWAYDLKTARPEAIKSRKIKTGDGKNLWGWGDKDLTENDIKNTKVINSIERNIFTCNQNDDYEENNINDIQILNAKSKPE